MTTSGMHLQQQEPVVALAQGTEEEGRDELRGSDGYLYS